MVQYAFRLPAIVLMLGISFSSQAAIMVSPATTGVTFNAAVSGNLDSFSDLTINTQLPGTTILRNAGPLAYEISTSIADAATSGIFVVPVAGSIALSTGDTRDTLTFSGFGSAVRAVGANFYGTNILGEVTAGGVTITVTDVNNLVFTSVVTAGSANSFIGFVSDAPIASVVARLTTASTNAYITVDNVIRSASVAAVPEPAAGLLFMVGILAIGHMSHRRKCARSAG